jgi:hypothetical protein
MKLHERKLHNLYSSSDNCYDDKIKADEMCGACSMYGRDKKFIQVFDLKA